jgi:hypothetical protein
MLPLSNEFDTADVGNRERFKFVPVGRYTHRAKVAGQRQSATIGKRNPAIRSLELANESPEIRGEIVTLIRPKPQDVLDSAFRGGLIGSTQEIVIYFAKIQRVHIEVVGSGFEIPFHHISARFPPQERDKGGGVQNYSHPRFSSSRSSRLRLMKSSLLVGR